MRKPEKIILPFGCSQSVQGHSTMDIVVQSQVFMRVERLWVSREVGKNFILTDIKVGNVSKFASCGDFSMAVFDNEEFHEPGQYPDPCIGVIGPHLYVGLRVRNGSPSSAMFSAHLEGVECEYPYPTINGPTTGVPADSVSLDDPDDVVAMVECLDCHRSFDAASRDPEECYCGSKNLKRLP